MAKKYVNFRVGGSPQKVNEDYSVWTNDLLGKVIVLYIHILLQLLYQTDFAAARSVAMPTGCAITCGKSG